MSEKIALAFCVHAHQPVGNFPYVFEAGARDCYLPFLEYLIGYPDLRMTLHYTGALLEWFAQHQPEFYDLIAVMVERDQVELMGGGFYEPILSVIPEDDARRQLALTNAFIEERFRQHPRGMWCAERIWDPCLPKKIAGQGLDYTLLDDTHFLAAGLPPADIHGYYLTEREGYPLKVFPIDMHLRYMIPFREPQETIDYLLRLRDKGVRVVTYGDDGEKFGMWPGTQKWVYQDGWLRRFMEAMSRVSSEIEVTTLASALEKHPPLARVYLPTASYQEMMEWSLFCEQGRYYEELVRQAKNSPDWERKRAFLRGGIWDNFLAKYPESNRMHKKMLKISALARQHGLPAQALTHLFMAQCNCGYWHGLFGGVYLTALRHAIYENLLKAEAIIDRDRLKDKPWIMERYDQDLDGREQIVISGRQLNCTIVPHQNAAVSVLEYKPAAYSLSNVMMRHPEIYHAKIQEQGGSSGQEQGQPLSIHDIPFTSTDELREMLVYDRYPRHSFITHVLTSPPETQLLLQGRRLEPEGALTPFILTRSQETGDTLGLCFAAAGALTIEKEYVYATDGLTLTHTLTAPPEVYWLAVEWNIMVFTDYPVIGGKRVKQRGAFRAKKVEFSDKAAGLTVEISSPSPWEVVILPIECASQSESGFEKTFQGWSIFFIRKVEGRIPPVTLSVGGLCPS